MSGPGPEVHAEILEIAYPSESSVYSVDHKIIDYAMASFARAQPQSKEQARRMGYGLLRS